MLCYAMLCYVMFVLCCVILLQISAQPGECVPARACAPLRNVRMRADMMVTPRHVLIVAHGVMSQTDCVLCVVVLCVLCDVVLFHSVWARATVISAVSCALRVSYQT